MVGGGPAGALCGERLASQGFHVTIFDELTPRELVARMLPQVLVKGGKWPADQIVGREEVETAGGKVVLIPVIAGYSTSSLVEAAAKASS